MSCSIRLIVGVTLLTVSAGAQPVVPAPAYCELHYVMQNVGFNNPATSGLDVGSVSVFQQNGLYSAAILADVTTARPGLPLFVPPVEAAWSKTNEGWRLSWRYHWH